MSSQFAGYTPTDLKSAYRIPTSTTTATVAIVDAYHSPDAAANMSVYRSHYHLPACTAASGCFKVVNGSGATSPATDEH